jgi:SAM-dependent methyltransferase
LRTEGGRATYGDGRRYERRRYGGIVRRINVLSLKRTLRRALRGVRSGGLLLDAPCGTGILTDFLEDSGYRVAGTDLSASMLSVARPRSRTIGVVRADIDRLPYRPSAFDAVVCVRFMMLLPAERRPMVLRALAALTDGPLIVTVCHPYTLKTLTRALRVALGRRPKKSPRLTRDQLVSEASAAGLRVETLFWVAPLLSEVWVAVLRRN